jgi:hypothetical protein
VQHRLNRKLVAKIIILMPILLKNRRKKLIRVQLYIQQAILLVEVKKRKSAMQQIML